MKKFISALIALSLLSSPAMAKPSKHHIDKHHHKPAHVRVVHHHKTHHTEPLAFAAAGLIGFTLGNIISYSSGQNNYIVSNDEKECFLVVSKSSGNVTQRCVDGSNQVLYVD
ncbi:MAG: hypothetical protein E7012_02050 [Alphaproteobacteria bacterium]|nr:hypothetical protein [Alphaproteobacteria bacterium]